MALMSFKKKTPEQQQLREKRAEKAAIYTKEAIAHAKQCLNSPLFEEYLKDYKQAASSAIDVLIDIDSRETDPIKYAFRVKDVLSKIRHLKHLGVMVNYKASEDVRIKVEEDNNDREDR